MKCQLHVVECPKPSGVYCNEYGEIMHNTNHGK